jgi:hypothetical protein
MHEAAVDMAEAMVVAMVDMVMEAVTGDMADMAEAMAVAMVMRVAPDITVDNPTADTDTVMVGITVVVIITRVVDRPDGVDSLQVGDMDGDGPSLAALGS